MQKRLLLSLILPLVAGAFYLRSLASWRPKIISQDTGSVSHLVFSSDGKTLLIVHDPGGLSLGLTALDEVNGASRWTAHYEGQTDHWGQPQFFASDTRILLNRHHIQILDAQTGGIQLDHRSLQKAAISPEGKWLAYNGEYPPDMGDVIPPTLPQKDVFLTLVDKTRPPKKADISHKITGPQNIIAGAFTFSPDGRTFVVGVSEFERTHNTTHLDFYDVKTWKRVRVCQDLNLPTMQGAIKGRLQWSRDGRLLLVSWYVDGRQQSSSEMRVSLWSPGDGKKLASATFQNRIVGVGLPSNVITPTFELQDDGRVLVVDVDGRVFLSQSHRLAMSPQPLFSLPKETVTAATLTPDGTCLVAGTQSGRVFRQRLK